MILCGVDFSTHLRIIKIDSHLCEYRDKRYRENRYLWSFLRPRDQPRKVLSNDLRLPSEHYS